VALGRHSNRPSYPKSRKGLRAAILVAPYHFGGPSAVSGEAAPAHNEIEPPAAPTKFPVGRGLQAGALLHSHNVENALVLYGAQFGLAVRTEMFVSRLRPKNAQAGFVQSGRAHEAANDISAKRRSSCLYDAARHSRG
jgi:hypothetical protein